MQKIFYMTDFKLIHISLLKNKPTISFDSCQKSQTILTMRWCIKGEAVQIQCEVSLDIIRYDL